MEEHYNKSIFRRIPGEWREREDLREILDMKDFNGWGCSAVSTKYIYERIQDILDKESNEDMAFHLSRLSDELAQAFFSDTEKKIGEKG